MSDRVDGVRVKARRRELGLSVAEAALRIGMSPAQLKRYEAGTKATSERVWSGLCAGLEVEREAIRVGGRSVAPEKGTTSSNAETQAFGPSVQINARISKQARNHLALAAHLYGCTQTAIIEWAAFGFISAAEKSLRERREKSAEMRACLDQQRDLAQRYLRHLDVNVYPRGFADDVLAAEEKSIEARDLFAGDINALMDKGPLDRAGIHGGHDEDNNPFSAFLQREAEGLADLVTMTRHEARYSALAMFRQLLGPGDAAYFAATGSTPFHDLPKALLARGKEEEARAWLMEKCDPDAVKIQKEIDAALDAALREGDQP